MASITQDSYDWGYDEGKAEGRAEGMAEAIAYASKYAVHLIQNEGWPLDKALSEIGVSEELKGPLEEEVRRRLK